MLSLCYQHTDIHFKIRGIRANSWIKTLICKPIMPFRPSQTEIVLAICFIAYLGFIIYGSLVPFELQHTSLSRAWDTLAGLSFTPLDKVSRVDWSTNILLGIPATFLGMAPFHRVQTLSRTIYLALLIFFICLLTSLLAEFLQIFFSTRIPSLNDLVAQGLGEVAGLGLYFLFGKRLILGFQSPARSSLLVSKLDYFFVGYLGVLFLYNLMPLDLTLNPADIHHQWKTGHIILDPFGFDYQSPWHVLYNTVVGMLIWAPGAFFLVRFKRFSIHLALLFLGVIALAIECLQLFVMSRFTDITDIFTALAGASLGAYGGRICSPDHTEAKKIPSWIFSARILSGTAALALWALCLCLVFWFPYNFSPDKTLFKQNLENLSLIPFKHYQESHIMTAITQFFRHIVFFLPGGAIIAFMLKGGTLFSQALTSLLRGGLFLAVFLVAATVEMGQFFLPGRVPDLTDIGLAMAGAWVGFILSNHLYAHAFSRKR